MLYLRKTFSYEYPLKESDVVLAGVPFDSTETGFPVRFGPLFIREAIKNLVGFDPKTGKNPFKVLKLSDLGDVETVPGDWSLTADAIKDTVTSIHSGNPKAVPVFLGGEHLITLAIVEQLAEIHGGLTVIQMDAHRDLMPDWMGNPHSHITWAHHAVSNKRIDMVQLGVRSWNREEEPDIGKVKESLEGITKPAYLTLDIDVLNPSYAPEVGTPEPGGMKPDELFSIVRKVSGMNLVGMDIVECASQRVGTQAALMCAQAFKEMLLGLASKRDGRNGG